MVRVPAILTVIALFLVLAIAGAAIPAINTEVNTVTQTQASGIMQRIPQLWALLVIIPAAVGGILAAGLLITMRRES